MFSSTWMFVYTCTRREVSNMGWPRAPTGQDEGSWSSFSKAQTGHINRKDRKASAIIDSNQQSWLNHLFSKNMFAVMTRCALCETYGPKCKLRITCSPERMTQECYVWGFGGPNRKKSKWGTMIPHFLISTCCQDMTRTKKDTDILLLVQDDITKGHGRTKLIEQHLFSRMLQNLSGCFKMR